MRKYLTRHHILTNKSLSTNNAFKLLGFHRPLQTLGASENSVALLLQLVSKTLLLGTLLFMA